MRMFLIVFTLFIAVGALGGDIMMWVDPGGNGWTCYHDGILNLK